MKILAIDTTKKGATISTFNNYKINTFKASIDESHSESLLSNIEAVLTGKNIKLKDIDAYGVVVGPGSFTGIRIGVSVIKAFMFGGNKKAVSVNSFDLLAYNIDSKKLNKDFLICLNADNKGAYTALYNYKTKTMTEFNVFSFEELENYSKTNKYEVYVEEVNQMRFMNNNINVRTVKIEENTLINLVRKNLEENKTSTINELEPLYIKFSQAQAVVRQKAKENAVVERAAKADADELYLIEKQVFVHSAWSFKSFESEFDLNDRFYYKIVYKGEILGFIGAWLSDDAFNILNLAIKPEFRGLKLSKKLMKAVFDLSEDKSINKMFLEVRKSNVIAQNLYEKFGFVKTYERKKYYKDGEDAVVMFYINQ